MDQLFSFVKAMDSDSVVIKIESIRIEENKE